MGSCQKSPVPPALLAHVCLLWSLCHRWRWAAQTSALLFLRWSPALSPSPAAPSPSAACHRGGHQPGLCSLLLLLLGRGWQFDRGELHHIWKHPHPSPRCGRAETRLCCCCLSPGCSSYFISCPPCCPAAFKGGWCAPKAWGWAPSLPPPEDCPSSLTKDPSDGCGTDPASLSLLNTRRCGEELRHSGACPGDARHQPAAQWACS